MADSHVTSPTPSGSPAEPLVLRLRPGDDLRLALEQEARQRDASWILLCGIGSFSTAMLRFAAAAAPAPLAGPLELLALAGTVCADGAHLHAAVANGSGAVSGGHVCAGCIVATTAEIALLPLRDTRLGRREDPATGHPELMVRPAGR
ncbi:PPC domain-containing DNA-binding protein [Pseudohaliea sp.]|uniref:PPC domain-containing DNA-binding protein n=1 Tax=Pseudohaliea sp. TaxID=2740289 RepID=UPI0032EB46A7